MATKLSSSNIELAEKFIVENTIKSTPSALSNNDIEYGKECFGEIQTLEPTSYMLFGSNAYGYTSYGFYKAKNNNIYVIEAFCNDIVSYYDPQIYGFGLDKTN